MLDTSDWSRLAGLMFSAGRLVEGLYAGRHGSLRPGAGQEFYDYRPYCLGDAPADIDWKLYGRTDRYYVRRHQLHCDLRVYLMVDHTASMNFAGLDQRGRAIVGPQAITKLRYAQTLAASIAFLTIRQNDRAGLGAFTHQLTTHLPPGGTWTHLQQICSQLEHLTPGDGHGNVGASLQQAHALMRPHSVVVVISDLLDDPGPLLESLYRMRHNRLDVIVFQVLTPQEMDLTTLPAQRLRMVDTETGKSIGVYTPTVQADYNRNLSHHLGIIQKSCQSQGIDYNLLTTAQPAIDTLRRYLTQRNTIGR